MSQNAGSFIGNTISIEGEVVCEEDLVLQGSFKGKLTGSEGIFIDAGAHAESVEIQAPRVELAGTVSNGTIVASDRVELRERCRAACTINTPRLLIDEGSSFTGKVDTPA